MTGGQCVIGLSHSTCLTAATPSPTALSGPVVGLGVGSAAAGSLDSIGSTSGPAAGAHSSRSNSIRPASPSPSLASSDRGGGGGAEENAERSEKEEEDRRRRQQLYVFVMRCVAYPFNAKQPTDMARRQVKVTRSQLGSIRERFQVS